MVRSAQLSFIRSRRAIHRSACSCMGRLSHRFSMLARVGFEMAWVVAARQPRADVDGRAARTSELRSALEEALRSIANVDVAQDSVLGGEMGPIESPARSDGQELVMSVVSWVRCEVMHNELFFGRERHLSSLRNLAVV